jgi:hypothetical protein
MRLNPVAYGIIVITVFMGTILVSQMAGFWSTSGKVTASGERVQPGGTNVDEIKGWMTIGEIVDAYDVPLDEVLRAFDLPADTPPGQQIKELESDTFSPASLRTWLKERMSQKPAVLP